MLKIVSAAGLLFLVCCAPTPGPTKRKMVGLLQKFDKWDYNGDGQLQKSELKEAEQLGGVSADEIIEFYDTSKNGRISLTEASKGLSRVDEARELTEGNEQ